MFLGFLRLYENLVQDDANICTKLFVVSRCEVVAALHRLIHVSGG
jgi:hypothetical protein